MVVAQHGARRPRRRWYLALLVLVLTVAAMAVLRPQPVYWTRVDVVFLPPARPGNALEGDNESLVFFAAAVERELAGGPQPVVLSSPDARLYGAGVDEGYSTTLARTGGQWQSSFDQPVLTVQVVMRTPEEAETRVVELLDAVDALAVQRQAEAGVDTPDQIRTQRSPDHPQITRVVGSATRALAGIGALGLAVAAAVLALDGRWWRRRGARESAATSGPSSD